MTEADMERLLDTRAGLALAHAAWSEGAGAMLRATNADGVWKKPASPYFGPLVAQACVLCLQHCGDTCTQPTERES